MVWVALFIWFLFWSVWLRILQSRVDRDAGCFPLAHGHICVGQRLLGRLELSHMLWCCYSHSCGSCQWDDQCHLLWRVCQIVRCESKGTVGLNFSRNGYFWVVLAHFSNFCFGFEPLSLHTTILLGQPHLQQSFLLKNVDDSYSSTQPWLSAAIWATASFAEQNSNQK